MLDFDQILKEVGHELKTNKIEQVLVVTMCPILNSSYATLIWRQTLPSTPEDTINTHIDNVLNTASNKLEVSVEAICGALKKIGNTFADTIY